MTNLIAVLYSVHLIFQNESRTSAMCGRFTLSTPASKLMEMFRVSSFPQISARYNIAPTQMVVSIRGAADLREAVLLRWGLVPSWAKDISVGSRMINARSETAHEKPSFRKAFQSRRCLIPSDGFYEWQKQKSGPSQPWMIHMPDQETFAFAGLWEHWTSKVPGQEPSVVETCTILTTAANNDLKPLHHRMPVFISAQNFELWLSDKARPGQLQSLMTPLEDGILQRHTVSTIVNKVGNDTPDCIAKAEPHDSSPPTLF